MKTLLIVRHAKSSWNDSSVPDFDRPLNERGKHDAPAMGQRIKKKKITIDAFISSPAKRAKKTAILFMEEYGADKKELILEASLYEATIQVFYKVIEGINDVIDSVAVFSHNPGITDFVNSLNCHPVYEMPTCAVFAVKIKTEKWKDCKEAEKDFLFFDYPKDA